MPELPNVFLRLSNSAQNIALVRQALSGVSDQLDLDAGEINDIRTAATEAANNVALHAYGGGEGLLELEVGCRQHALEVVIRDHGSGIRPRIRDESESALGIGLAIIQALARRVEFNDPPGGGTEVRMEFPAKPADRLDMATGVRHIPPVAEGDARSATTAISVAPPRLAQSVLPRVLTMLAAHARFTTDRIADVQLLADALVAQSARDGEEVSLTVRVSSRRIELDVGPMAHSAAHELAGGVPGREGAGLIAKLTDERRLDAVPDASDATVLLALTDQR